MVGPGKALVLGTGGREHAIGWAFMYGGYDVWFYPGNGGTCLHGYNLEKFDERSLKMYDIVIPGSEDYLVRGIADGRKNVFGPDSKCAKLEASKCIAKLFMKKYGIRTARFEIAERPEELPEKLKKFEPPYVIKLDGLAHGKGVILPSTYEEAVEKGTKLMTGELLPGLKGSVVIEEFLSGRELSAIAVVSDQDFFLLPFVRDYKRAFTGDKGPNTGGMGCYGPIEVAPELRSKIEELIVRTLYGLKKERLRYRGFLYLGLMIVNGEPYVLEYNVRMGDPECETIVSMAPYDFFLLVKYAAMGVILRDFTPQKYVVDVVIASEGYPDSPRTGQEITIERDGNFFYAGVRRERVKAYDSRCSEFEEHKLYVSGGRVLHSIGRGDTLEEARRRAYENIKLVKFEGMFYREDIALEAVQSESAQADK